MSKRKTPKPAPAGSDAAKAAELTGGSALPPSQIGDAAENADKAEAATAKTAEPAPAVDEPGTVAELTGGAGALPGSLEPAAENARNAAEASEPSAATKPVNPNDAARESLKAIAGFVGPAKTAETLARYFGTDDPDKIGVHNLPIAIDELHKVAD